MCILMYFEAPVVIVICNSESYGNIFGWDGGIILMVPVTSSRCGILDSQGGYQTLNPGVPVGY